MPFIDVYVRLHCIWWCHYVVMTVAIQTKDIRAAAME